MPAGISGNAVLSDVVAASTGDQRRITYRAALPVAWPKDHAAPASYELSLPRDVTALDAFNRKYDGRCGRSEHFAREPLARLQPGALRAARWTTQTSSACVPRSRRTRRRSGSTPSTVVSGMTTASTWSRSSTIIMQNQPNDWGYSEGATLHGGRPRAARRGLRREQSRERVDPARHDPHRQVMNGGRLRDVKIDTLVVESIDDAGPDSDARYDALSEKADLILFNVIARSAPTRVRSHGRARSQAASTSSSSSTRATRSRWSTRR